jgi:hypothetical protein
MITPARFTQQPSWLQVAFWTSSSHRAGAPRRAALNILLDWWGTFQPEPGYEEFQDLSGNNVELIPALMKEVTAAKATIQSIPDRDPIARKPALVLLQCIEAGWLRFDPRY